jgi:hypothetical protein
MVEKLQKFFKKMSSTNGFPICHPRAICRVEMERHLLQGGRQDHLSGRSGTMSRAPRRRRNLDYISDTANDGGRNGGAGRCSAAGRYDTSSLPRRVQTGR